VAAGIAAAALFAAGTALQYRTVRDPESSGDVDIRSVALLTRQTVSSPRWLAGTGVLVAGLGLHAFALHQGSLTLVQPLLATGVLFALPASSRTGGPPVTAADMRWAVALVAALTIFLLTATPSPQAAYDIDTGPAVVTFGLAVLGISACVAAARRRRGPTVALLLGTGAGIALAGSAAFLKVCTDLIGHGVGAVLGSWQLYALCAVGISALLLSQLAYRAGPMVSSLPAINTTNPVVSVVIGTAVFDERFRTGFAAVSVEGLSLAVVLAAIVHLSRRPAHPQQG
jgi:hypothetical protein